MVNTRMEARVDGLKRELGEIKGKIGNLDVNLEALKEFMAEICIPCHVEMVVIRFR